MKIDIFDLVRRSKRLTDPYISSRKAALILLFLSAFVLYLGPYGFRWLQHRASVTLDPASACISELIGVHNSELNSFDASVKRNDIESMSASYLPFVGNGYIGVDISSDGVIYMKNMTVLSVPLKFTPFVTLSNPMMSSIEGTVIRYIHGVVNKYRCLSKTFKSAWIRYRYFAHRTIPALFIQEIQINNALNEDLFFKVQMPHLQNSNKANVRDILLSNAKFRLFSWTIPSLKLEDKDKVVIIVIITSIFDESLKVSSRSSRTEYSYTIVRYGEPVNYSLSKKMILDMEQQTIKELINLTKEDVSKLLSVHQQVWNKLWKTGFGISTSKAAGTINGDKINATIYYALSNSRAYLHENSTSKADKENLQSHLSYSDHCYGGHQTLQASSLWSNLESVNDINYVTSLWLLTLTKRGCHQLVKAGTDGVIQAMVLSLGSLSFSDNHLEFNLQPKDLHRDYLLRRINYGVGTHVNISVVVGEDNKAVLYASLDQNDKEYYACDGGCLDAPVQLSKAMSKFPVKKTEPPTPVLYITSDREHMEQLKHTIHVTEVVEAPAHEHHVIALHKHGHHWGGLPPLFWISIVTLVLIFHLFLFKLIYNEYCSPADRYHFRYTI